MMDRLEAMGLLKETVERGSMSAAARALGTPLPTLSRKLAELEAQVGVKLLHRTSRSLHLTEAGAGYLAAARRILDQVHAAEQEALGGLEELRGGLVVTAPLLFGRTYLLPLVADFLRAHPQVDVRLLLTDRPALLMDERIDAAVRIGPVRGDALISSRLGVMRLVTCASPTLLAELGEPARPADLAALPAVTLSTAEAAPAWALGDAGEAASSSRLAVTTAEAAVDAAVAGVGVARLLHYQAADAVAEGRLRLLLEAYEPPPAPVHALHVARGRMPLKLRRFLDHCLPPLRRRIKALPASRPVEARLSAAAD